MHPMWIILFVLVVIGFYLAFRHQRLHTEQAWKAELGGYKPAIPSSKPTFKGALRPVVIWVCLIGVVLFLVYIKERFGK